MRLLIRVDEATVRDRERLVNEYGIRSIIDLRTKYAPHIRDKACKLTITELSILNKPKSAMLRSRHLRQYLNRMMMSLDL